PVKAGFGRKRRQSVSLGSRRPISVPRQPRACSLELDRPDVQVRRPELHIAGVKLLLATTKDEHRFPPLVGLRGRKPRELKRSLGGHIAHLADSIEAQQGFSGEVLPGCADLPPQGSATGQEADLSQVLIAFFLPGQARIEERCLFSGGRN